jgi:hypothetical protein
LGDDDGMQDARCGDRRVAQATSRWSNWLVSEGELTQMLLCKRYCMSFSLLSGEMLATRMFGTGQGR